MKYKRQNGHVLCDIYTLDGHHITSTGAFDPTVGSGRIPSTLSCMYRTVPIDRMVQKESLVYGNLYFSFRFGLNLVMFLELRCVEQLLENSNRLKLLTRELDQTRERFKIFSAEAHKLSADLNCLSSTSEIDNEVRKRARLSS